MKRIAVALALVVLTASAHAAATLRVVTAGPVGEVASQAEANEIRAVFSEPMVVLGRIPQPVVVPFVRIEPAVKGSFRWSGTTTLIFTPEKQLPFATEYKVTIDKSAKAVSGNTLDQTYSWTFVTPTIRLLRNDYYRKPNGAVVIGLRFNQPVDPATVVPHIGIRTRAHEIELNDYPENGASRITPAEMQAFDAKVAKAREAAASDGAKILAFIPTEWDKERITPGKDLVVLETKPGIPPDTWLVVNVDDKIAASPRNASGPAQSIEIQLEPTFFVTFLDCYVECDPEMRNAINFRSNGGVRFENMQKAVQVFDITDPAKEVPLKPKATKPDYDYPSWNYSLDDLGFSPQPGRRYAVRVDPSLASVDGQKLGYVFAATFENWNRSAFVSFGSGQGVWETSGGPVLPFHSRNFKSVKQWLAPVAIEQLMPTLVRLRETPNTAPDTKPTTRTLKSARDKIAAIGLDLKPAIGEDNLGFAWAAVQPGEPMAKSKAYSTEVVSTVVQTTNLGISLKDSPQNALILVTRLDDAKPVAGAKVSIRTRDNKTVWSGTTDANGLAVAPNSDYRRDPNSTNPYDDSWTAMSELHFIVLAEKDGDVAYLGSDWNEGLLPWEFDTRFDLSEAEPQLRGTIFADRGVYKLGEEIHFKLIARADTPNGMQLVAPGTKFNVVIRDSHGVDIDTRTVEANAWSSAEWTFKVPADGALGSYGAVATTETQRGTIYHEFLVAAYRRPDFRVDTTLTSQSAIAGAKLDGRINGRYLFGGAMAGATVNYTYKKTELTDVPQKIADKWSDQYTFLGRDWEEEWPSTQIVEQKDGALDAKGFLNLKLDTDKAAGAPFEYELEGVVTDVTRQQIAGRASLRVEGTPWYIGVKRPPYFADTATGIDTAVIAAGLDGLAVAGVNVKVELKRLQWVSARQAEGDGFYEWESERKEVAAGDWTITTKTEPVPLKIPLTEGGEYLLIATAQDSEGRTTRTRSWFYAVGDGYTAWERYDHNRIDLIPEKKSYKPGETARIMIKSPWEKATALLTTEREGVRTWKPFELTSTQQTITVPIGEKDIPNVFVSVLLVKGRTQQDPGKDGSDPGKPAFRLGYVELKVEDASKRLSVDVKANRDEFRPATKAKIDVTVKDAAGKPSQSEVTLWAVDYGVLSLTGYTTPDVLDSIYLQKALQVLNEDSRQRIVSRRVMTPKGADEGGGGGRDAGPGTLRKDFRVLAFWVGSLVTDAKGRATKEITLPESLTTYRIMAVAGDRQSRFGFDDSEIRINKPLMLTPAWPRFLAVGDKAFFGGVVHNTSKTSGKATVTIESLDPNVLSFANGSQSVQINASAPTEVRFDAFAHAIGEARVRMRVTMGRENDAFEEVIPVRILLSPETVAAYGEAKPTATETLEIPKDVVPNFGGMRIELASTAMVGLAEGVRYLVEYPYGCAEQRSSRTLGMMLGTDLGATFNLPGVEAGKNKAAVQSSLVELAKFQCYDGGFSFWAGDCNSTSPYLTSYVLHVLQRAKLEGYAVDPGMLDRGYSYLEGKLNEPPPSNEGWRPAYNAWQAFSIKVLAEGGRNADSHLERVYGYRDRMPVFALAYLHDALLAKKETSGARYNELHRRLLNSISPEGGHAFVNELRDPYLLWFWSSNVRSTAIVLDSLVRGGGVGGASSGDEEIVKRMVRWLIQARKHGRWNDTQENAWALMALVDFYRKYEAETPDFVATLKLGSETLASETFKGRSTTAKTQNIPMQQILAKAPAGQQLPLVFTREGAGTLYYMLRLRYAANVIHHEPLDQGFRIERTYTVQNGGAPSTSFKAGDLIEVTLRIRNTKERRYVALTDPIPAGTEPVESWFATTASALIEQQSPYAGSWAWWERGGFDHVERHDDRVGIFATRLAEGDHEFKYLVRATTSGTFIAAPAHAEEMYEPEVFGRTATAVVEVGK
ncbi:MAG TPA: alpha-2-macroglobulin family protein [Thermoanaerobaculia bacterium]|nr:alpha-2-macroglobulin family protein [Thermoanaerobaculia bacterium]